MNTKECAEFTGIPESLLERMRTRVTTTWRQGPPFAKVVDKDGVTRVKYSKKNIKRWMKKRNLLLTADEAAALLGITRYEILEIHGLKRFDLTIGHMLVDANKNMFILVLDKAKAAKETKKRASK